MANNKLTVEFDITTQFGPRSALDMIQHFVNSIPAIKTAKVIEMQSDYKPKLETEDEYRLLNSEFPFLIK